MVAGDICGPIKVDSYGLEHRGENADAALHWELTTTTIPASQRAAGFASWIYDCFPRSTIRDNVDEP
jgi:hypothetical protein